METSQLLERAELLFEQKRVNDCINYLKKLLEQEPENDEALALYARCFFAKKEFDKGIEIIRNAISINPQRSYYFYLLGFAYYRKDQYFAAIENLEKAIQMNPHAAEFFGVLAYVYLDEKRFHLALEKADEGLKLDPENITCLNARSSALVKLRRKKEAKETMQSALEQDPENEFTHEVVGWNLLERGNNNEAIKHFREALRINPELDGAKEGLKKALKSKIPPYRWLLQYSFWLENKGKNFRVAFFIFIIIGIRVIAGITKNYPELEPLGYGIGALYFLFVVVTWVINPVANLFLLVHKDGKHALTVSEKWEGIGFAICIFSGIMIMVLGSMVDEKEQSGYLMGAGFMLLSLGVPVGHMDFPIRFSQNSGIQWFSMSLIALAIFALTAAILGSSVAIILIVIYVLLFVLFLWLR